MQHAKKSVLETPVGYLKGVGPKKAELLNKELSIFSFKDLLYHSRIGILTKLNLTRLTL